MRSHRRPPTASGYQGCAQPMYSAQRTTAAPAPAPDCCSGFCSSSCPCPCSGSGSGSRSRLGDRGRSRIRISDSLRLNARSSCPIQEATIAPVPAFGSCSGSGCAAPAPVSALRSGPGFGSCSRSGSGLTPPSTPLPFQAPDSPAPPVHRQLLHPLGEDAWERGCGSPSARIA